MLKRSGLFPSKHIWKTVCYRAVHAREESTWVDRMDASVVFTTFKQYHTHLRQSNIWIVAKLHPFTLSRMKFWLIYVVSDHQTNRKSVYVDSIRVCRKQKIYYVNVP